MTVIGTRPEAIKMAPLLLEMDKYSEIESKLVVTGQHKEMLNQVLHSFQIEVDENLHVMKENQSLTSVTVDSLTGLEPVLKRINPNVVLVHGDTTTTLAASLAAFYQQIPVGHVEAGLRTSSKYSPYPEEMNRRITSQLADLHFAPTEMARQHLLRENIKPETIIVTGNTAIDALGLTVRSDYTHPLLTEINGARFLILTTHRRENVGDGTKRIFKSVLEILSLFPDLHVVYPIHKNPKIREIMREVQFYHSRLHVTDPLETIDFHNIASRASLILTDSGGIQEEAPSFGVPVLVLREQTERPEGVEVGVLKLVGTSERLIVNSVSELLTNQGSYEKMSRGINPYGDGQASTRIIKHLIQAFSTAKKEEKLIK